MNWKFHMGFLILSSSAYPALSARMQSFIISGESENSMGSNSGRVRLAGFASPDFVVHAGISYQAHHVKWFQANDEQECQEACRAEPSALAYTWAPHASQEWQFNCFLSDSLEDPVHVGGGDGIWEGVVSGIKKGLEQNMESHFTGPVLSPDYGSADYGSSTSDPTPLATKDLAPLTMDHPPLTYSIDPSSGVTDYGSDYGSGDYGSYSSDYGSGDYGSYSSDPTPLATVDLAPLTMDHTPLTYSIDPSSGVTDYGSGDYGSYSSDYGSGDYGSYSSDPTPLAIMDLTPLTMDHTPLTYSIDPSPNSSDPTPLAMDHTPLTYSIDPSPNSSDPTPLTMDHTPLTYSIDPSPNSSYPTPLAMDHTPLTYSIDPSPNSSYPTPLATMDLTPLTMDHTPLTYSIDKPDPTDKSQARKFNNESIDANTDVNKPELFAESRRESGLRASKVAEKSFDDPPTFDDEAVEEKYNAHKIVEPERAILEEPEGFKTDLLGNPIVTETSMKEVLPLLPDDDAFRITTSTSAPRKAMEKSSLWHSEPFRPREDQVITITTPKPNTIEAVPSKPQIITPLPTTTTDMGFPTPGPGAIYAIPDQHPKNRSKSTTAGPNTIYVIRDQNPIISGRPEVKSAISSSNGQSSEDQNPKGDGNLHNTIYVIPDQNPKNSSKPEVKTVISTGNGQSSGDQNPIGETKPEANIGISSQNGQGANGLKVAINVVVNLGNTTAKAHGR